MGAVVVQTAQGNWGGASLNATVTLNGVTAGNAIIVAAITWGASGGGVALASVNDGTVYTQAAFAGTEPTGPADATGAHLWYCENVSSGTHNIVCRHGTPNGAANAYGWIIAMEVSGLPASGALDTGSTGANSFSAGGGNQSAPTVAGAGSIAQATGLLVAVFADDVGSTNGGVQPIAGNSLTWANQLLKQDGNAEMAGSVDTATPSSTLTPSVNWGTPTVTPTEWATLVAFFKDTGGGSTYSDSVDESTTASDAPDGGLAFGGAAAEYAQGAEACSATGGINVPRIALERRYPRRAQYGAVPRIAGGMRSRNFAPIGAALLMGYADPNASMQSASASESASASDAPSATAALPASASEAASAADASSGAKATAASTAEAGTGTDSASAAQGFAAAASESASAADAPIAAKASPGSVSEAASGADAPSAAMATAAAVSEAASAADTASAGAATYSVSASEAASAADAPAATMATAASASEAASAADTASAGAASYSVSASESASAADAPSASMAAAAAATEAASAADSPSATKATSASASEAASAADAPAATASMGTSVSEAGSASDTSTTGGLTAASTTESASATDTASASRTAPATVAEAATAIDSAAAVMVTQGSIAEGTASATDLIAAAVAWASAVLETALAADTPAAHTAFLALVNETVAALDTATVIEPNAALRVDVQFIATGSGRTFAARAVGREFTAASPRKFTVH